MLSSLDIRGIRESHLHSVLQNIGPTFKETVRKNLSSLHSGGHISVDLKKEVELDLCSAIDSSKALACVSSSPGPLMPNLVVDNGSEENDMNRRYKDFEWIWKECFASNAFRALRHGTLRQQQLLEICNSCHIVFSWEENHCPSCHRIFCTSKETLNFAEHVAKCNGEEFDDVLFDLSLPPRIVLLKVQLATIEVVCFPLLL